MELSANSLVRGGERDKGKMGGVRLWRCRVEEGEGGLVRHTHELQGPLGGRTRAQRRWWSVGRTLCEQGRRKGGPVSWASMGRLAWADPNEQWHFAIILKFSYRFESI
jgi:hypothetical protein